MSLIYVDGLETAGPAMALSSAKGLSEADTTNGPGLRGMAFASLKGFPKSRFRSPREDPRLPPPPSRVRDTRRRCASRSNSPSSMFSSVKKSGLLVNGLVLDVLFDFVLPPMPRAAKMSFLLLSSKVGVSGCWPLNRPHMSSTRSLIDMSLDPPRGGMADALLPLRPFTMGDVSMNCELPRSMSTDRPLLRLPLLRMLPLRLMVSKRPRTRPYCDLNAAFTLVNCGVGPMLPRAFGYGRFSPPRPPKEGSTERGVRRVLLRLFNILLLQNQMKNAIRPRAATPPMTPPATATVELLLLMLVLLPETATNVVVAPAAWLLIVEEEVEEGLLIPIVVNAAADVDEASVCKTSLWGGGAEEAVEVGATSTVDEAALLVSATLAWVCGMATVEDETATGLEATIENWASGVDVVTAGGGVAAAAAVA